MAVAITTDTAQIRQVIEPVLLADPVRHTVLGTLRTQLTDGWCAYDSVAVAARSDPERPVVLSEKWAEVSVLADALAGLPSLAGLGGPARTVDALLERLDRELASRTVECLMRLDRLVEPTGVRGQARLAGADDIGLIASWIEPYQREVFGVMPAGLDPHAWSAAAVEHSWTWLWLTPAGEPVSMAARRAPAAGVSRIGPVYTPPEQRGRGYASAVTARAAWDILDHAAVPVLYTDLANPTSNKIYRAIGFRPVTDRTSVTFG
jgi:GNAT superfamily N-acetyltransferase